MNEIEKAIKLLRENGYKVIKETESMKKAMNECERLDAAGESKDCGGCSCSICIMQ